MGGVGVPGLCVNHLIFGARGLFVFFGIRWPSDSGEDARYPLSSPLFVIFIDRSRRTKVWSGSALLTVGCHLCCFKVVLSLWNHPLRYG